MADEKTIIWVSYNSKTTIANEIDLLRTQILILKAENERLKLSLHSQEGGTLYSCTLCGKSFMTDIALHEHKKEHSSPKHQCVLCDAEFNDDLSWLKHSTHDRDEKGMIKKVDKT